MNNFNMNFHQTFPPTAEFLMRLLEICDTDEPLSKEEISEKTGIPTGKSSGKVEPHIFYAEFMGLLNDRRRDGKHLLASTALGRELLKQDPGMQEKVSTAVCHSRISSGYGGAPLWRVMFKEILPKYPNGISEAQLKDELEKAFDGQIKTGPFFSSYAGMFSNLNLLDKGTNRTALQKCSTTSELIYTYAYALLYEWEEAFPQQSEITSAEVASLRIGETFGFSATAFYSILENLAERTVLRFNRQLAPYTLIKLTTSESIIPLLFSELC